MEEIRDTLREDVKAIRADMWGLSDLATRWAEEAAHGWVMDRVYFAQRLRWAQLVVLALILWRVW